MVGHHPTTLLRRDFVGLHVNDGTLVLVVLPLSPLSSLPTRLCRTKEKSRHSRGSGNPCAWEQARSRR
jgi:hypothetical protein